MNDHQFEFEECIGTGGFGVVYRARMTTPAGLVRTVAVKALRSDVASGSAVARLRDEAKLLAALQHRSILAVHDLVRLDGRFALVSEYVEGADLAQLVRESSDRGGPVVPDRVAVQIVGEVAGALAAAWSSPHPSTGKPMNLVHRDIKPANIRVSTSGAVKLLDFGIAKSDTVSRDAATATGMLAGTYGYLSPDRLTEEVVGPAGDIYALGLVLYEVLTSIRLYRNVDRRELMRMAVDREAHDAFLTTGMHRLCDTDPVIQSLVRDMLQYAPEDRPSAAEVEARAEDVAENLEGPRLRRWARNRAWATHHGTADTLVGRTMSGSGLLDDSSLPADAPNTYSLSGSGTTGATTAPGAAVVEAPADSGSSRWVMGIAAAVGLGVVGLVGGILVSQTSLLAPASVATTATGMAPAPELPAATAELSTAPTTAEELPAEPAVEAAPAGVEPSPGSAVPPEPPPPARVESSPPPDKASPPAPKRVATGHSPPAEPPTGDGAPPSTEVSIQIGSYPLGAEVKLQGRVVCTTPCSVSVEPGNHLAEFTLADGRTAMEVLSVSSESTHFGHKFAPE